MESEKVASAHSDLSARRIALGAVGGVLPFRSSQTEHMVLPTRSGELEVVGRMYRQQHCCRDREGSSTEEQAGEVNNGKFIVSSMQFAAVSLQSSSTYYHLLENK